FSGHAPSLSKNVCHRDIFYLTPGSITCTERFSRGDLLNTWEKKNFNNFENTTAGIPHNCLTPSALKALSNSSTQKRSD
ncbi:MAG: hypothetical protein ACLFSB_06720, partial [Chitinispirillaceae bacterium]